MAQAGLFGDLPEMASSEEPRLQGKPRLLEPVRDQIELRAVDLDSLIGADHPVRVIWAYVEKMDVSPLEDEIKAREGHAGHPAIAPRLLVALWLYAVSQGVGSARALERLCESEDTYRWLCGGVSVNYHSLADFRVAHGELLDRLLAESVAALAAARLIDLSTLTQDGIKVRADAGATSFRRRATLEQHLVLAYELVEELKREVHDDPAASNKRIKAARQRAARERVERLQAALQALGEVEAVRKNGRGRTATRRRSRKSRAPPRPIRRPAP